MSPFLVVMRLLVCSELPLLVIVLFTFLRLRKHDRVRMMLAYLVCRILPAIVITLLLCPPREPESKAWFTSYFYLWFGSSFAMTGCLYGLSREAVSSMLGGYCGLRRLSRIFYCWLLMPAALLVAPPAVYFLTVMGKAHLSGAPLDRFLTVYSFAQLLPVAFAFALGLRLGLTRRHRLFGILLGLMLEPGCDLLISMIGLHHLWGWQNFLRQVVTDGVLVLWIVSFAGRYKAGPVVEADATLLHWDAVAREIAHKDAEQVVMARARWRATLAILWGRLLSEV